MVESFKFEPVLPCQIDLVSKLAREIWPRVYADMITSEQIDYMLGWMYSPEKLRSEIESDGVNYFFIRTATGKPCGFYAFGPVQKQHFCFVHKIYVHPDYHRQGLATQAISEIEKIAMLAGANGMELRVNRDNTRAISLYEKTGFEIVAEDCADIGGGFVMDDFIFQKTLN